MEGERESQVITTSNCVELDNDKRLSNSTGCSQQYSLGCRKSGDISSVASVTTQCNIHVDENTGSELSPKLVSLKRLSGWMSSNKSGLVSDESAELSNKENCSSAIILETSRATVSNCQTDLQNCQYKGNVHSNEDGMSPQRDCLSDDSEVLRKAKEEGVVDVVFPGYVTKEACCQFVGEILKCVLYQRQQLPMTFDQLNYHQKQQQQASTQEGDIVGWRPPKAVGGLDWRKCQRTLQDIGEVLGHLELLFSLTLVPRVLLVLGGSLVLPKELYEINMEEVALSTGDGCLRASVCLRKIFRTLFVADILTDARPVQLLSMTVLALGHRDCGVSGFRPKLDFKVPTRVKKQVIHLACEPRLTDACQSNLTDWGDYVWFQAPVAVKGFCK